MVMTLLTSCTQSTAEAADVRPGQKIAQTPEELESYKIKQYTDEILQALARREFDRLVPVVESATPMTSGLGIARRLLGPEAGKIIIERWDAQQMEVTFDEPLHNATAQCSLTAKTRPNRRPRTIPITFTFHRESQAVPWRLVVPE